MYPSVSVLNRLVSLRNGHRKNALMDLSVWALHVESARVKPLVANELDNPRGLRAAAATSPSGCQSTITDDENLDIGSVNRSHLHVRRPMYER